MEHYLVIKKIIYWVLKTGMDRESILLSEINQTEKTKMILFHSYVEYKAKD